MVSEHEMEESNTPTNANINPDQTQSSRQADERNTSILVRDPAHPSSPYYIGNNDGGALMLVTHVLDSTNYYSWARSMRRALRIKNKLGFIDGTLCEPNDPNDPLMEHWLGCNDIVITWIKNAMAIDIKSSIIYAETAHLLWLDLSSDSLSKMHYVFLKLKRISQP